MYRIQRSSGELGTGLPRSVTFRFPFGMQNQRVSESVNFGAPKSPATKEKAHFFHLLKIINKYIHVSSLLTFFL